MIETATDLTNATNGTTQLESGSIGNMFSFFSEPYVIPIIAAISLVVLIIWKLREIREEKRALFRDVYKEWLKPGVIKFTFDERGLYLRQQTYRQWSKFFKAVKRSWCYMLKGRRLHWKAKKMVDKYVESTESVNTELTPIISEIQKELGLPIHDWRGTEPSEYTPPTEEILPIILNIVTSELKGNNKHGFIIRKGGDNKYPLYYRHSFLGQCQSDSDSKMEVLKKSFQSVVDNKEVRSMVKDRMKAKRKAQKAVDAYNNILAEAIERLRF